MYCAFTRGCLAVTLFGCVISSAPAQSAPHFSLGGIGAAALRGSEVASVTERLTGVTLGLEGRAGIGPVFIDVRYLEGTLTPSVGSLSRDVVEGEVLAGVQIVPWLAIRAGPHIRSYLTGDETERWVMWEGRLRGEAVLYRPRSGAFTLQSYVEGWLVFSGDVNLPDSYDNGGGGEGGLGVRLAQSPFWARLGYRIDRGNLGNGNRRETVEQIVLAVGVRR